MIYLALQRGVHFPGIIQVCAQTLWKHSNRLMVGVLEMRVIIIHFLVVLQETYRSCHEPFTSSQQSWPG